jgi:hypothetical protein
VVPEARSGAGDVRIRVVRVRQYRTRLEGVGERRQCDGAVRR